MKTSLKNKRLNIDESVSLIKDDETGKKSWRHRFRGKRNASSLAGQEFKDYVFKKFESLKKFESFIVGKK